MHLLSAEGYKNAEVDFLKIRKTDEIWVVWSMTNVHDGISVKNMSDLVLKWIYGKHERKNLSSNEIKKYKISEREMFKKYDNLYENEVNSKNNKKVYVKNYVMTSVIVRCRGGVKRKKNRWMQKKIRGYRVWYSVTQWILNQIKNRKNIYKWKSTQRILC